MAELTLGGVARLVVVCEPAEVEVLKPRNPLLVLRVVCVLGPLHLVSFLFAAESKSFAEYCLIKKNYTIQRHEVSLER